MPAPAAPENFRVLNKGIAAGADGLAKIRLGWDEVAGASYRVQVFRAGGGVVEKRAIRNVFDVIFRDLAVSTTYSALVRAENADGESDWVPLEFSTPARVLAAAIPAPSALSLVSARRGLGLWSWTDNAGNESAFRFTSEDGIDGDGDYDVELASSGYFVAPAGGVTVRPIGGTNSTNGTASNEVEFAPTEQDFWINVGVDLLPAQLNPPMRPLRAWRGFPLGVVAIVGSDDIGTPVAMEDCDAAGLPAGLSIVPVDEDGEASVFPKPRALIAGTSAAAEGRYSVTLTAEDEDEHDDEFTFLIDLTEPEGVFDAATGKAEATITASEPFSIALRFDPPAMMGALLPFKLTAATLPPGVSLSANGADSPVHVLSGTVPMGAPIVIELVAEHEGSDVECTFTLRIVSPIIGEALGGTIHGTTGKPLLDLVSYNGDCQVNEWFLLGGPPGVELAEVDDCAGGPYDAESKEVVAISGAPEVGGLYDATLAVKLCCTGFPRIVERTVRFAISGGLFIGWFHEISGRRDVQIMQRTRDVHSFAFGETLWLKRGDDAKFHLIFRDGPLPKASDKIVTNDDDGTTTTEIAETNFGNVVSPQPALTALYFVLRLATDPDETVLLRVGAPANPPKETVAGRALYVFTFKVEGDALDAAIEKAGRETQSPPASIELDCIGEFNWIDGGRRESSRNCKVVVVQDIDRQ